MRRPNQILIATLGFIIGIILSANFNIAQNYFWIGLTFLCVAGLFFVRSKLGYILIAILFCVLGIWRFSYFVQTQHPTTNKYHGQKVEAIGTVVGEPSWDEWRNYVFYIDNVSINSQSINGLVRVKTIGGAVKEGQVVSVKAKIKPSLGRADSLMSYAQVYVISRTQSLPIVIKTQFINGLNTAFGEQIGAFFAGILIGSRSGLDKTLQDALNNIGLSHMVAVSGYNLTILVGFMQKRLLKKWKWGGLALSLWAIVFFVVISGASPSIVRAGIMSSVFLLANYYGKKLNVTACLSITAAVMILINPDNLISDIGWQLSFLSLLGITILSPRISALLPSKPKLLNDILSVTLAAQVATLGLVAYKFGRVSLIAPLANLIIMPIIPVLMAIGVVCGLLGILIPLNIYALTLPIRYAITQLFSFINYLANIPGASVSIQSLSLIQVTFYYILLSIFVVVSSLRKDPKVFESNIANQLIGNSLTQPKPKTKPSLNPNL